MKKVILGTAVAVMGLAFVPTQSFALSCLDPDGMIEYYVENADYQIVLATPTDQKEFIKKEADETDPNTIYPEGYTGQLLEVKKSYRGGAPDQQWVYFERNGTWNYLCVGEPAKVGTDQVYVLHKDSGLFALTTVAGVYEADSDIAKKLLAEIKAADSEFMEEAQVYETTKDYWIQQLHDELKEMAFFVKLKLAEWNFWRGA